MLNQNPLCRRTFLTSSASGLGGLALAGMMDQDAARADESQSALTVRQPHFPPRATNCIFVYAAGGPSQFELFDSKPLLNKKDGDGGGNGGGVGDCSVVGLAMHRAAGRAHRLWA